MQNKPLHFRLHAQHTMRFKLRHFPSEAKTKHSVSHSSDRRPTVTHGKWCSQRASTSRARQIRLTPRPELPAQRTTTLIGGNRKLRAQCGSQNPEGSDRYKSVMPSGDQNLTRAEAHTSQRDVQQNLTKPRNTRAKQSAVSTVTLHTVRCSDFLGS